MTIIDNQDRSVLSEGRNWGMGFAFCKRIAAGKYETIQPLSPCKDYLNDVIAAEYHKKKAQAYGLKVSGTTGIFDKEKRIYLAIKIHKQSQRKPYVRYKEEAENLDANYKNIQDVVNQFEALIGLRPTLIIKANDGMFLVNSDPAWAKTSHAISLLTLLIRVAQQCKEKTKFEELIAKTDFGHETMLMKNAIPKIKKIVETKKMPEQDLIKYKDYPEGIHCYGIIAWKET